MANSESIKKYLIEGEKSYLENDANNGNILMLSGVWGSGKTHFWKNIIETDLIPKTKAKKKSYVFVSLYGKDSIEELKLKFCKKHTILPTAKKLIWSVKLILFLQKQQVLYLK